MSSSSNSNNGVTLQIGPGVTDAGLDGRPQLDNAQVHGGVTRVTVSGGNLGQPTSQATARVTGDDLRGNFSGSILSTARTRSQMPARELTPDTLVTVGDLQVTLRDAEINGYVRRDEQGRYQEVSPDQQQQQQPKQNPEEIQPEAFAPEVEQEIARLTKGVPGEVLGAVAIDVALQAIDGKAVNPAAIASRTGMSHEAANGLLMLAGANFQAQVDRFVNKAGANPDQFYDWARTNKPDQLRNAVSQLLSARTTTGFAPLVDQFMRNTMPTPETLKHAGYETKTDRKTGQTLVNVDGMWVSAQVAARLKRI